MALFGPSWWHHHGVKMQVREIDFETRTLVIGASAAQLVIEPHENGWLVGWEIQHCGGTSMGSVVFATTVDLYCAFGISAGVGNVGDYKWLDAYSPDSAIQGKYIRTGDYLNIPCPGTGHDGDPNISLDITDEIRESVRRLVMIRHHA